jgi:hypothetical protein
LVNPLKRATTVARTTALGILAPLKQTLLELGLAIRHGDLNRLVSLLKDGSPLEQLIDRLLVVVFWLLLILPVILVPIYYLGLGLLR